MPMRSTRSTGRDKSARRSCYKAMQPVTRVSLFFSLEGEVLTTVGRSLLGPSSIIEGNLSPVIQEQLAPYPRKKLELSCIKAVTGISN